jgi:hypothetical protein
LQRKYWCCCCHTPDSHKKQKITRKQDIDEKRIQKQLRSTDDINVVTKAQAVTQTQQDANYPIESPEAVVDAVDIVPPSLCMGSLIADSAAIVEMVAGGGDVDPEP